MAQAAHEERARGGTQAAGPDTRIRLLLWRHGQTAWNVEGRFQGQTDIPLDETGEQQAERAARLLAALRPDVIISSDLSRAMATAAPLARLTGLTVSTDKDLRERHGGAWEGLSDVQIRTQYPVEHAQWLPPGGRVNGHRRRAGRGGAAPDRRRPGPRLTGRGGQPRRGAPPRRGGLLGLPEDLWGIIGPLSNCSWSVLARRSHRWRLIEHNAGTLPEPVLSDDR